MLVFGMRFQIINYFHKMHLKLILIFARLLMLRHSFQERAEPIAIELIINYPISTYVENNQTKLYVYKDTISIYFYKSYILYQLSKARQFETDESIGGSESYFIYKTGELLGLYIPNISALSKGEKMRVDSFLTQKGYKSQDFELPPTSSWKLVYNLRKTTSVIQKFEPKKKDTSLTSPDAIYYYFDRSLSGIPYSFSKKLDSIYSMKLDRVRLCFDKKYSTEQRKIIPAREFSFELRRFNLKNPAAIIEVFSQYENYIKGK